jgi:hypothetical protein
MYIRIKQKILVDQLPDDTECLWWKYIIENRCFDINQSKRKNIKVSLKKLDLVLSFVSEKQLVFERLNVAILKLLKIEQSTIQIYDDTFQVCENRLQKVSLLSIIINKLSVNYSCPIRHILILFLYFLLPINKKFFFY